MEWPFRVHEVLVPCAGKLQPEHFLKAFEGGADLVGVVCCDETNCHYLEGSRRAKRRIEYVRGLLDELGLGGDRLLMFHLPGSAGEDMALGCGRGPENPGPWGEEIRKRLTIISNEIAGKLDVLGATPLRRNAPPA